jgi:hypothetical protein
MKENLPCYLGPNQTKHSEAMKINADRSRLIAIKVSTNLLRLEMGISYFYCEKELQTNQI